MEFCSNSSGFADFDNTAGSGSAQCEFWRGFRIAPVLMFGSWVLKKLDQRPFFSLGRYVNEFIQIFFFFKPSSLKLRCDTVIGIALCYRHQASCLLHLLLVRNY